MRKHVLMVQNKVSLQTQSHVLTFELLPEFCLVKTVLADAGASSGAAGWSTAVLIPGGKPD